jgi:hypothetical protein
MARDRMDRPRLTSTLPSPKPTGLAKSWEAVRQEKLERARELLQNAQYPSDEVIESVAKLLARNWRRLRRVSGHSLH